ncbi:hypothetical protein BJX76DRAFT_343892 [Aspergillus varians]
MVQEGDSKIHQAHRLSRDLSQLSHCWKPKGILLLLGVLLNPTNSAPFSVHDTDHIASFETKRGCPGKVPFL